MQVALQTKEVGISSAEHIPVPKIDSLGLDRLSAPWTRPPDSRLFRSAISYLAFKTDMSSRLGQDHFENGDSDPVSKELRKRLG